MPRKDKSRTRGGRRRAANTLTDAIVLDAADPPGAAVEAPRNHRELAEAIFAKCDAVKVGRELLESGSEKGVSVRARVFEMLANWLFGKTAGEPPAGRAGVQIIWDVPRPPRETEEPEP